MMPGNTSIILAEAHDLDELVQLYRQCAYSMNADGLFNWSENYPGPSVIKKDINNHQLYAYKDPSIQGAFSLCFSQPEYYKNIKWSIPDKEFLVIRRLAVHPRAQGKGIAKELVEYSETYANNYKFSSIRLDVYSLSTIAVKLYKKCGYQIKGVFLQKGIEEAFFAMEKVF
jgi:ribosomal protein S18 acetylase RimI-like enzyme